MLTTPKQTRLIGCYRLCLVAFLLLTFSKSLLAFEGVVRYRLSIHGDEASSFLYMSEPGDIRLDLDILDPNLKRNLRTSVIVLTGNQDEAWQIVHNTKTYARVLLAQREQNKLGRYQISPKNFQQILGRKTQMVTIVDTVSGDEFDVWVHSQIQNTQILDRLLRTMQPHTGSLQHALQKVGISGLPLRFEYRRKRGGKITGVAEDIHEDLLPKTTFSLPKGYFRGPLPGGLFSPLPGGANDPLHEIKSFFGGDRLSPQPKRDPTRGP
jgi:hypothetical protein